DRHGVDAADANHRARVWGVNHQAVTDIQANVRQVTLEEHEVAWDRLVTADRCAFIPLCTCVVAQGDPRRRPGRLGETGAVVADRTGAAPLAALSELAAGRLARDRAWAAAGHRRAGAVRVRTGRWRRGRLLLLGLLAHPLQLGQLLLDRLRLLRELLLLRGLFLDQRVDLGFLLLVARHRLGGLVDLPALLAGQLVERGQPVHEHGRRAAGDQRSQTGGPATLVLLDRDRGEVLAGAVGLLPQWLDLLGQLLGPLLVGLQLAADLVVVLDDRFQLAPSGVDLGFDFGQALRGHWCGRDQHRYQQQQCRRQQAAHPAALPAYQRIGHRGRSSHGDRPAGRRWTHRRT